MDELLYRTVSYKTQSRMHVLFSKHVNKIFLYFVSQYATSGVTDRTYSPVSVSQCIYFYVCLYLYIYSRIWAMGIWYTKCYSCRIQISHYYLRCLFANNLYTRDDSLGQSSDRLMFEYLNESLVVLDGCLQTYCTEKIDFLNLVKCVSSFHTHYDSSDLTHV